MRKPWVIALVALVVCGVAIAAPVSASHTTSSGVIELGMWQYDLPYPPVGGYTVYSFYGWVPPYVNGFLHYCASPTAPNPSVDCIEKPDGVTSYELLPLEKTTLASYIQLMDMGSVVMVLGYVGTVNQPYTIQWNH